MGTEVPADAHPAAFTPQPIDWPAMAGRLRDSSDKQIREVRWSGTPATHAHCLTPARNPPSEKQTVRPSNWIGHAEFVKIGMCRIWVMMWVGRFSSSERLLGGSSP